MHSLSFLQVTAILAIFGMTAATAPGSAGVAEANGDWRTKERTPLFFASEKEAMQSREFKKCSFSNTCLLVSNGYSSDLAVWGEITGPAGTRFVRLIMVHYPFHLLNI